MRVRPPVWHFVRTCPCCGQGEPELYTCPSCGRVVLICAEIGTVFPDPRYLGTVLEPDAACPGGCMVEASAFRPSTGDEVRALGFVPGEYA